MKKNPLLAALALAGAAPWAGAQVVTTAPSAPLLDPLARQFATPADVAAANGVASQSNPISPTPNAAAAMAAAGLTPPPANPPQNTAPPQPAPTAPPPMAMPQAVAQPAPATVQPAAPAKPRFVPDLDYNRGSQQYYEARGAKIHAQSAAMHSRSRPTGGVMAQSPTDLAAAEGLISSLRNQGVDESKIKLELGRRSPADFRRWAAEALR